MPMFETECSMPNQVYYRSDTGYWTIAKWSLEDDCWYGELEGLLDDRASWTAKSQLGIANAVENCIKGYLEECLAEDKEPEVPIEWEGFVR